MCTRLCFTSCGVVNSITHAGMPIVSCAVSSSGSPSNFFFVDWLYIVQTPKHTNHSLVILISFFSFFAFLSFFIRFLFFLLCGTEASTPPVYYILHSGSRVSPLQWYKCPYSHFKIHLPLICACNPFPFLYCQTSNATPVIWCCRVSSPSYIIHLRFLHDSSQSCFPWLIPTVSNAIMFFPYSILPTMS